MGFEFKMKTDAMTDVAMVAMRTKKEAAEECEKEESVANLSEFGTFSLAQNLRDVDTRVLNAKLVPLEFGNIHVSRFW